MTYAKHRAWLRRSLAGLTGAATAIVSLAANAADYNWRLQSNFSAGSEQYEMLQEMVDQIETQSGGRLDIRLFPSGAVVDYTETLDAIQSGILDAHQTGSVYFYGKDPGFAVAELPGAYPDGATMQMFLEYGGGLDFLRKLYDQHGLYTIGYYVLGPESLVSKTPLRGVEDLEGFKLRAPQGLVSELFERLGANPVVMSGPEIYTAVERGVLDGTDWAGLAVNDKAGFHDIAPYPIYPGFHTNGGGDISVSKEKWEELPDDIKAIVEMAARDFARNMWMSLQIQDAEVAARLAEDPDVELIQWPEEEKAKVRAEAREVWEEWSQQSEMAKAAYDLNMDFMKRIGLIEE